MEASIVQRAPADGSHASHVFDPAVESLGADLVVDGGVVGHGVRKDDEQRRPAAGTARRSTRARSSPSSAVENLSSFTIMGT